MILLILKNKKNNLGKIILFALKVYFTAKSAKYIFFPVQRCLQKETFNTRSLLPRDFTSLRFCLMNFLRSLGESNHSVHFIISSTPPKVY